jgi:type IV secretory pathway VirB4 component
MGYLKALRPLLRRRYPDFGDRLPWEDVLDRAEGIWSTRDDGLLTMFRLWPRDLQALEHAEQGGLMLRINEAFKRLPAGWAVWFHLRRVPYTDYPDATWPHPVAALIDDEYREHLTAPGTRWTSEVYLSLWRKADTGASAKVRPLLLDEPHRQVPRGAAAGLRPFRHEVSRFIDVLALACRQVQRLDGDAGARYLHSWISPHDHPVTLPDDATKMRYKLRDVGFTPGLVPTLGAGASREYLKALDLNYKLPRTLTAAMFRDLHTLDVGFDLVARWVTMDVSTAESRATSTQINILSTKQGFKAQVFTKTNPGVQVANSYVDQQAKDADAANLQALSDEAARGSLTMTWLARSRDLAEVDRALDRIAGVVRRSGCITIEEDINTTEAFLGAMPGQAHLNLNHLELDTLNLADLCVWHLPWEGVPDNEKLKGPAVCQALTDVHMPYHLNTHVGDLADTTTIGPKGSGKSTKDAFTDYLQWQRYECARTIGMDVGYSWECVTRMLGGAYHDLGASGRGLIQALYGVDDPHRFPFIYGWLVARLTEAGKPETSDITRCLMGGLNRLRNSDSPRRMTSLIGHLRDIKNTLEPESRAKGEQKLIDMVSTYESVIMTLSKFAEGGVYGHLTDAPVDGLSIGRIHTFELERLLKMEDAWPAVLSIIFERLAQTLDGSPTRLLFGEAWVIFRIPEFLNALRDWMPSWRRRNASGNFSTQSISQLIGSPLTPLLYESCQVRCFLPNPQALDDEARQGYEGMRLNREELLLLTQARPKRDVYVVRPEGRRLIDLALPPMARAICGANSPEDLALIGALVDRYGADEFPYRYLAAKGYEDAARRVMQALEGEHHETAAEMLARAEAFTGVGAARPRGEW